MNFIYLDIETFGEKPDMKDFEVRKEDIVIPGNYKKPESMAKYVEEEYARLVAETPQRFDQQWRKNALDLLKAKVIAISYAVNDEEERCIIGDNEFEVMREFNDVLGRFQYGRAMIVDWNGLEFDCPILSLRAAKYDLERLYMYMPKDRREILHVDLMRRMNPTNYKSYCKLDDACKFFGIEGKMSGMDGSKVHDLYLNGELETIARYSKMDVKPLREIARKLRVRETVTTCNTI